MAPATGADLHHRVRHEWLDRLRRLRLAAVDLRASGQPVTDSDRPVPDPAKQAARIAIAESFGCELLFEVEAFRADELSTPEESSGLLEECANIALASVAAGLEENPEVKLHPEWLPELTEALRDLHRHTLASLAATTDFPIPPYRWRLPTDVHAAAWDALNRQWPSYRRGFTSTWSTEYEDLVGELRNRGVHRVLILHHPAIARFSCETDVALLAERRVDWLDWIDPDSRVTCPTFDWVVDVGMYGLWHAYGWA